MLTLYTTTLSANGRKVLAVARHLGIDIKVEHINVYKGEGNNIQYRSLNPWGKIPTMVDDEFVLWESNAILIYLSESHGNNVLFSNNKRQRAHILKWLFWESSHWQPVLNRVLSPRVAQLLFPEEKVKSVTTDWNDRELIDLLTVLETVLDKNSYICSDSLTIADFAIAGMTSYFYKCEFPFSKYPAIYSWFSRMNDLDHWKSTEDSQWSADHHYLPVK